MSPLRHAWDIFVLSQCNIQGVAHLLQLTLEADNMAVEAKSEEGLR